MEPRAPIAVPTRADLEIEWAIDAVLLGAEDRSQVLRHGWANSNQSFDF